MAEGEVGIRVSARTGGATRALEKLRKIANQTQLAVQKLGRQSTVAANKIVKFGRKSRTASKGVAALSKAARSLFVAFAAIGTARFVFVKGAEIETQTKSLEVLTGSLDKTKQIIGELQAFGAVTPFKSSELIDTAKRLKAFGFETDELVDVTKRLGDVAGATGADLGGVVTAFGQIRAKGKVAQEEINQLTERGVDITSELKRITGLQGDAFESAQRKGEISAKDALQALVNLTNVGGKYANGAIAQSTTLAGKFSTLVDNIERLAQRISEVLAPAIKGILDLANKGLSAINDLIGKGTSSQLTRAVQGVGGPMSNEALKRISTITGGIDTKNMGADQLTSLINKLETTQQQIINTLTGPGSAGSLSNERDRLQAAKTMKDLATTINTLTTKKLSLEQKISVTKDENNAKSEKANTLAKVLGDEMTKVKDIVATGLSNAIMGLIDGTKSLGESLAGIAKQLGSMFLNSAMQSFVGNILPASADGRYASGPMISSLAERGEPEYVIPASKMSSAMQRYSAGARGQSVIPGTGSSTSGGGGGSTTVNYSGPILTFNSEEFVPKAAVGAIIASATSQGAAMGETRTIRAMQNRRSIRTRVGI